MKKILLIIVWMIGAAFACADDEIHQAKAVTGGACWRFGLDRSGANNTKGVSSKTGEKWRTKVGDTVLSSPVLWEGTLYVGSDEGFFALDASAGKKCWDLPIEQGVVSSACIADGFVYFTAGDGFLYSVDAKTGAVKWKVVPEKSWNKVRYFSPAVAYGLVFSLGSKGIKGFDVETGKEVWATAGMPVPATVGVTLTPDYLFHTEPGGYGTRCLSLETGLQKWRTTRTSYSRSTVAVANGKTYSTSAALIGTAPCFPEINITDIEAGKVIANPMVEPDVINKDKKAVFSSTTIWNGKIYLGCDSNQLLVFDDQEAKPLWSFETEGPVRSSASVSTQDGVVYFTSYDGKLYALDANTGKKKWDHKIADETKTLTEINSCPWVEDGVVYIGTAEGDIVAIH